MSNFVLISKDAMCTDYLPIYGNRLWSTYNIDSLSKQGTVFYNHYTAAPSTVMSFYSMITSRFAHETKYEMYERINDLYKGDTFFSKLVQKGYSCHIIWGDIWMVLPEYFDCYRNDVQIHMIKDFKQGVGAHYKHDGFLTSNETKKINTFYSVKNIIEKILSHNNVFLWIHFPHVINGEVAYGSDIELFDDYVGIIRNCVSDNNIAITADHGNMNGHKGKICYGYDVYQPNIKIPLITSRIADLDSVYQNTSSVDLYDIIVNHHIPNRKFVYSDSAYRAQKHRKLAIIYNNFKYIYNKSNNTEELYDLKYDPNEEFSIMYDWVYDYDRKINTPSRELYYYPYWNKLPDIRKILQNEKDRIWKNGSLKTVLKSNLKDFLRPFYERITVKSINN